jgi:hypothetical protein
VVRMSNDRGFIVLHRKIFENLIVGSRPDYFRAWVWLVSEAKYKPVRYRIPGKAAVIELQRGQLSHARSFISKALGMREQRVRTFLKQLKIDGMITIKINQGQMVITICNYDLYQDIPGDTNQQTNRQINQPPTSDQPELNKDNKETKDIGGAFAPPAERKSRKKPSQPMPDIFPMTDKHREYAAKNGFKDKSGNGFVGFTDGPAVQMFVAFKNHHIAKGSIFADWDAAWRTWVDNEVKFSAQRSGTRRMAGVPKL